MSAFLILTWSGSHRVQNQSQESFAVGQITTDRPVRSSNEAAICNVKRPAAESEIGSVTRREALLAGSTVVAGAVANLFSCEPSGGPQTRAEAELVVQTLDISQGLIEPYELRAAPDEPGKLSVDLEVVHDVIPNPVGEGKIEVRRYVSPQAPSNPTLPGPTLRVKANSRLDIRLSNNLVENAECRGKPKPCDCDEHVAAVNGNHCLNTTNLHTHGLHVSPKEPQDNVFVAIPPKGDDPQGNGHIYQFRFEIPAEQPGGTHWYHPHKHGSTDVQVQNGMAGVLVVDEANDETLREILQAEDKVLVLQDIQPEQAILRHHAEPEVFLRDLGIDPSTVENLFEESERLQRDLTSKELITINGQLRPIIRMRPGEVQRWRVVNATVNGRGFVALELRNSAIRARQIAVDGLALPAVRELTAPVVLAPGNRTDLMVQAGNAGQRFELWTREFNPGGDGVPAQPLASVEVEGEPKPMTLPSGLLPVPDLLKSIEAGEVSRCRTVEFQNLNRIDGRLFDPHRTDQCMELNAVEQWTIRNATKFAHPFHIHTNPFQVLSVEGDPNPEWVGPLPRWQDTISIPPKGHVVMRTRFLKFDGPLVLHCHILRHEDHGMMQKVQVLLEGQTCMSGVDQLPNAGQLCVLRV
jgi:FtsP/CotA-like multicopper oxidase with cupredoxin domain